MHPIEIPKLKRIRERFVVGTVGEDLTGLAFIIIALVVFTKTYRISLMLGFILPLLILALGFLYLYFKINEKIKDWIKFSRRSKNIGYYDKRMAGFIGISSIRNNTIFLKNGQLAAVLRINPIDFSILSEEQKETVINSYRRFKKSLICTTQSVSKSEEVNLDNWLYNLEQKAIKGESKNKAIKLNQFKAFKEWINEEMEEGAIRNRVFYIIIPYEKAYKKTEEEISKVLTILSNSIENAIEKIEACSLKAKRLNDNELLSLFSSYFTNVTEVDVNYLSPVMFPKTKEVKEHARV